MKLPRSQFLKNTFNQSHESNITSEADIPSDLHERLANSDKISADLEDFYVNGNSLGGVTYDYGKEMCIIAPTYGYKTKEGHWKIPFRGEEFALPKYNLSIESESDDFSAGESNEIIKKGSTNSTKGKPIETIKSKFNDPIKTKKIRALCTLLGVKIPSEEDALSRLRERLQYFQSKGIVGKSLIIACKEEENLCPIDEIPSTIPYYKIKDPKIHRPDHGRVLISDCRTVVKTKTAPFMGYFEGTIMIPKSCGIIPGIIEIEAYKEGEFIPCCSGRVNLIDRKGISVISDIDDTIKLTKVYAEKEEVFRKTFFEEPVSIPEMAQLYGFMQNSGVDFHYVSGSPRQLAIMLMSFLKAEGFPPGSVHLRDYGNLRKLFTTKKAMFKLQVIRKIMRDFPERKFLLIGDSGEIDLEIYASIASEFHNQVLGIFIRDAVDYLDRLKKRKLRHQFTERLKEARNQLSPYNIDIVYFSHASEIKSALKLMLSEK